mmetsp:Transcript_10231/g.30301  ORF Transcript_10231/g.30301 Transcript_10231/m.30301 type:complete len:282 (+) Transcript_10231:493-1338(+)
MPGQMVPRRRRSPLRPCPPVCGHLQSREARPRPLSRQTRLRTRQGWPSCRARSCSPSRGAWTRTCTQCGAASCCPRAEGALCWSSTTRPRGCAPEWCGGASRSWLSTWMEASARLPTRCPPPRPRWGCPRPGRPPRRPRLRNTKGAPLFPLALQSRAPRCQEPRPVGGPRPGFGLPMAAWRPPPGGLGRCSTCPLCPLPARSGRRTRQRQEVAAGRVGMGRTAWAARRLRPSRHPPHRHLHHRPWQFPLPCPMRRHRSTRAGMTRTRSSSLPCCPLTSTSA